ncbi:SpoIIE family protein phosphatase [uncultured Jatrophihabitans sp.]|uniref:SpoIIE family protein phosphatase n=1 Tax=uncultured Jatrophihabitans sp. TaxID=1610747 RepID=UPI0035CBA289
MTLNPPTAFVQALAPLAPASELPGANSALAYGEDRRSSITIPVDLLAPRAARRHAVHVLGLHELEHTAVADVELLVSEVVANVVRHEKSTLVDVDVVPDVDHAVTVAVSGNAGTAAVPLLHPAIASYPGALTGRGLTILDSLADAWGIRREAGRTAVWFTVRGTAPAGTRGSATDADAGAAAAVLAGALAVTAATAAELTAPQQVVAQRAAVMAEQAALGAAAKSAQAAKTARGSRAVAATLAAKGVAETAARTVEAVQLQADEMAREVASAASVAAAALSRSILPGGDAAAARAASQVAAAVISAAAATSEETARAALVVARAVAAAADAVAATTAAAAAEVADEVSGVAHAVHAVAAAAAQQLASDTLERGAALALVARDATLASERLEQANELLLRAGRADHAIALALQAAMLTNLPRADGLQLAARYLTAAKQAQVGGDWYDAIVLPDRRSTTLVIGDVVGHDIVAAATMGQLRNLLRALTWAHDGPPSAVVTRLDRAMRDLRVSTMATLVMLTVESTDDAADPTGAVTMRWTNAGHPAPILINADGTVVALDTPNDVLLGVAPDAVRTDHVHTAQPGSTLILYTDGLIEKRDESIVVGQDRLVNSLAHHRHLELGALLDTVIWEMVGDQPGDDVAVLAARFGASESVAH